MEGEEYQEVAATDQTPEEENVIIQESDTSQISYISEEDVDIVSERLSPQISPKIQNNIETESFQRENSNDSTQEAIFPQSYDDAKQFLQELLKSYYQVKFQEKKQQSSLQILPDQLEKSQPPKQMDHTKFSLKYGLIITLGFILIITLFTGAYIKQTNVLNEQIKSQSLLIQELEQKLLALSTTNLSLEESNEKLVKKNQLLQIVAQKAVNEEKRNCDVFDIVSIIQNSFKGKRDQNLIQLCSYYSAYLELEDLNLKENGINTSQEDQSENEETPENNEYKYGSDFGNENESSSNQSNSTESKWKQTINSSKQYIHKFGSKVSNLFKKWSFSVNMAPSEEQVNEEKEEVINTITIDGHEQKAEEVVEEININSEEI